ncbi:DUF4012 domain-containing protein [Patescibacteria group bacterium]|nr:DUF4012 domain-containing protein [Patescibacteria group bacterium]
MAVKRITTKHQVNFKNHLNFEVPADNVLDLKKLAAEKEEKKNIENTLSKKTRSGFLNLYKKSQFKKTEKKEKNIFSYSGRKKKKIHNYSLKDKFVFSNPFSGFDNPFSAFSTAKVRGIIGFVLVAAVCVLPIYGLASYYKADNLKEKVLGVSWEAYDHLGIAAQAFADLEFENASFEFKSAIQNFVDAQKMLETVSGLVKIVPVASGEVSAADSILKSGESISSAGNYLTKAFAPFVGLTEGEVQESFNFTAALLLADANIKPAVSELKNAEQFIEKVSVSSLPSEYREQFLIVQGNMPALRAGLEEFSEFTDFLLSILGHGSMKRYLFAFQNNAELRPTGGFIGSFALMTFNDGIMKELEVPGGGSYDLNGWLQEQVIAPRPLHLVNPHWYFQDANWFPDFPTSAEKLMWFFTESGGPSTDGVIALTPNVIESLLSLSGPIDMTNDYGVTVNAENFRTVVKQVEQEYENTNKPKRIISDLTPLVFNKILELDRVDQLQILGVLNTLLKEKHLLLYFTDDELQQSIVDHGWAGEILDSPNDYLSIINTNIAGGKTDLEIDELIDYNVEIQEGGEVTAKVTVTRTHTGQEDNPITGIKNMDFMRMYVPEGSTLIEADGFSHIDPRMFLYPNEGYEEDKLLQEVQGTVIVDESSETRINNEFSKTVFGNWVATEAGKTSQVSATYRLPFTVKPDGIFSKSDSYSLFMQKQSGTKGSVISTTINFPNKYDVVWQYPSDSTVEITPGKIMFTTTLNLDRYIGFVFQE